MRLLLDTHAWLWFRTGSARLGTAAHAAMIDSANEVIVSVASAWEVGIKVAGGKLVLPQTLEGWLGTALSGFDVLPIGLDHVRLAVRLPMHHKDPFDRVLVAQALAEGLTLVTADPQVQLYGAPILPADA